jgi:hypothetical protein
MIKPRDKKKYTKLGEIVSFKNLKSPFFIAIASGMITRIARPVNINR